MCSHIPCQKSVRYNGFLIDLVCPGLSGFPNTRLSVQTPEQSQTNQDGWLPCIAPLPRTWGYREGAENLWGSAYLWGILPRGQGGHWVFPTGSHRLRLWRWTTPRWGPGLWRMKHLSSRQANLHLLSYSGLEHSLLSLPTQINHPSRWAPTSSDGSFFLLQH